MESLVQAGIEYSDIVIPAELNTIILETVEKSGIIHHYQKKNSRRKSRVFGKLAAFGIAAAGLFLIMAVNISSAFASKLYRMPVIGEVAQVLTFQSQETAKGDYLVSVQIPGVQIKNKEVNAAYFSAEISDSIQQKCNEYLEGAVARVKEYRQAFLGTGGTEEAFADKKVTVSVDYKIKSQTEGTLSFVVEGTESWISAYAVDTYYNLDLQKLEYLGLQDVLGTDWIKTVNVSIKNQMEDMEKREGETIFWSEAEGGFSSVDAQTKFYINEDGNPVVVFDKYEIAPGAYGDMHFEIER